jgi:23S rRNA (guanosine2251-2'-O)-methyltransferase
VTPPASSASIGNVVYGRNPVAEARRGQRRVLREWTAEQVGTERLERLCGSADHQGIVAEVEPYPYADANQLLAEEDALLLALDQVQDPRNLGAICRTAEAAGVAAVVICDRRASQVTAAVCKASAGAVEHLRIARVRNLADWLLAAREQGAWSYGAAAEAPTSFRTLDLSSRVILVLGGEAPACGRGSPPAATGWSRFRPWAGSAR